MLDSFLLRHTKTNILPVRDNVRSCDSHIAVKTDVLQ